MGSKGGEISQCSEEKKYVRLYICTFFFTFKDLTSKLFIQICFRHSCKTKYFGVVNERLSVEHK